MPKKILLSAFLAVLFISLLVKILQIDPGRIWRILGATMRNASIASLVIGFILHLIVYLLKALRFRMILGPGRLSWSHWVDLVTLHNFANFILPFRTGELAYVYLLNRRENVPLGESVGSLLMARIFDLLCLALLFPVCLGALFWLGMPYSHQRMILFILGIAGFSSIIALLLGLTLRGETLVGAVKRIVARLGLDGSRLAGSLLGKLQEVVDTFSRHRSRHLYSSLFGTSLLILFILYLVGYILLHGLGVSMSYLQVVFCLTLMFLSNSLPINSLAGIGTMQGLFILGCEIIGLDPEIPYLIGLTDSSNLDIEFSIGLAVHFIIISYVVLLGLYGAARYRWRRPSRVEAV